MLDWIDLTFDTAEENLACDEVLLDWAEREDPDRGLLRFWEPATPFVVVGHAGKVAEEVGIQQCKAAGVPILRRVTGGGSVLQGPGCWNYSLVLPMSFAPDLAQLSRSNAWVLQSLSRALRPVLGPETEPAGLSDLTLGSLKISGNAQRRKRRWLLFHGTLLRDLDIALVDRTLSMPPRQPEYRRNRAHADFIRNTGATMAELRAAMKEFWKPAGNFEDLPMDEIARLARDRYRRPEWNFRF